MSLKDEPSQPLGKDGLVYFESNAGTINCQGFSKLERACIDRIVSHALQFHSALILCANIGVGIGLMTTEDNGIKFPVYLYGY